MLFWYIWTFLAVLAQGESLQQERPEQLSTEQGCCRHAAASVPRVAAAVMQFRSRSPAAAVAARRGSSRNDVHFLRVHPDGYGGFRKK